MPWGEIQAAALRNLFAELGRHNIRWLVARNYHGLPETNVSKDVDILVDRSQVSDAIEIAGDVMAQHGFSYQSATRFQYVHCTTFYSVGTGASESIKIDIFAGGYVWRGAEVIPFAEMYERRSNYNGFPVVDEVTDALLLWLKPLMAGGLIKQRYRAPIRDAALRSPEQFRFLLTQALGTSLALEVWECISSGDLDGTVRLKQRIRATAWRKALGRSPLTTSRGLTLHVREEVTRRLERPRGSMIAVVGPDGAGKSTFIEQLRGGLAEVLIRDTHDVVIRHHRPGLLPNIRRLIARDGERADTSLPHSAPPSGLAASMLRHTYYWIDYVVGYFFDIRRQCIAGRVVVFDRYCYDFVVDPARSRVALPVWVRRAFLALTPEPDVVFFLDCDPSTVRARKQELPEREIARQLVAFRGMASRSTRFVTLNASKSPVELCRDAVMKLIPCAFRENPTGGGALAKPRQPC